MSIAVITHGNLSHTLRCGADDISWTYNLNTKVDFTYGGRVVQLLSVNFDDLTVQAKSGSGGWNYYYTLVKFCRDVIARQVYTGEPATFSFPSRGWRIKAYLSKIPYSDSVGNTAFPFTLQFKVQEDVSGTLSNDTLTSELNKIRDGIGYERNDYNYPSEDSTPDDGKEDLEKDEKKDK